MTGTCRRRSGRSCGGVPNSGPPQDHLAAGRAGARQRPDPLPIGDALDGTLSGQRGQATQAPSTDLQEHPAREALSAQQVLRRVPTGYPPRSARSRGVARGPSTGRWAGLGAGRAAAVPSPERLLVSTGPLPRSTQGTVRSSTRLMTRSALLLGRAS